MADAGVAAARAVAGRRTRGQPAQSAGSRGVEQAADGGLAAAEGRARARGGEDAGSWLAAASETLGMGVQDSCE